MQQRPQLVIPRRLPPAVGVDTAKYSFDLPSFCGTFDFFRLHFYDNELLAAFPAETKDKPSSQDGVRPSTRAMPSAMRTTKQGEIPGKGLSERSKRRK
jgi:hypothetical protein